MSDDGPPSQPSKVVIVKAAPAAQPRRLSSKTRSLLLRGGAIACIVLALAGGGTAFGWWVATNTVVAGTPNGSPEVVEVALPSSLSGDLLMPDIRGLDPQAALEVLADAGIEVGRVTTEERPAAGPPGIVLQQTPVFGTVDPAEVLLVISAPSAVPDLIGLKADDAASQLIELGARVTRVGVYVAGAELGIVQAVEPAAGAPLADRVTITVSTEAVTLPLIQVKRDGSCSDDDDLTMDGQKFTNGMHCASSSTGKQVSWQLGNAADRLSGTIGVPDAEEPGSSVHVSIIGDGVELTALDVGYGTAAEFDVALTGVIRLTFVFTATAGASPEVGLAELKLLGSAASLATLPRR